MCGGLLCAAWLSRPFSPTPTRKCCGSGKRKWEQRNLWPRFQDQEAGTLGSEARSSRARSEWNTYGVSLLPHRIRPLEGGACGAPGFVLVIPQITTVLTCGLGTVGWGKSLCLWDERHVRSHRGEEEEEEDGEWILRTCCVLVVAFLFNAHKRYAK